MKKFLSGLLLGGLVVGLVFVAFGFFIRTQMWVDYNSGYLREKLLFGPFELRDDQRAPTLFGGYPSHGSFIGGGSNDWHLALEFAGPLSISVNYKGGHVLSDMGRLGQWFPLISSEDASLIKALYLLELRSNGVSKAGNLADRIGSIMAEDEDDLGAELQKLLLEVQGSES